MLHRQIDQQAPLSQGSWRRVIQVRYLVLLMLFVASSVAYGDRALMGIVGSMVSSSLGISHVAMGFVLAASSASYLLMQVPAGLLLDRYGARWIYTGAIVLCALFTMAQGGVNFLHGGAAVVVLVLIRFLFGIAAAPCIPANARLTACWFPAAERGIASAIFNSAQYFALLCFGPLIGWIAHTVSWQSAFIFVGSIGLAVAVIFPFVVQSPLRHPLVGREELEHIQKSGALVHIETSAAPIAFPWQALREIAFHQRLLGLYLYQYCIGVMSSFFFSWFPIYLVEQLGMSVMKAGVMAGLTALFGFLGNVLGGVVSDKLLRSTGSLTKARRIPALTGLLLAATIVTIDLTTSRTLVIVVIAAAFFGKGLAAMGWTMVADMSPRDLIGAAGGLFNMVGNIAGVLTPIVIGTIVAVTHTFDLAIVYVAAHCLIGIMAFTLLIRRIERIELRASLC